MKITNLEILLFIMGYQGGTVHQAAEDLDVSADKIINADYDEMQDLMRKAQRFRGFKDKLRIIP